MNYLRFDDQTNAENARDNMNTYIGLSADLVTNVEVEQIGPDWVLPALPGYNHSNDNVTEVMDNSWYKEQKTPKFLQWVSDSIKKVKPFQNIDLMIEVDHNFYKSEVSYDVNGRPNEIQYYEDNTKSNLIFTRRIDVVDYMNPGDSAVPNTVPDRMILTRTERVRYILNSGDFSDIESVKIREYHPLDHYRERTKEAKMARENITDILFKDVLFYVLAANPSDVDTALGTIYPLMVEYENLIASFTEAGNPQIATAIQNDTTYAFLDLATPYVADAPTIRDYVVKRITRQAIAS